MNATYTFNTGKQFLYLLLIFIIGQNCCVAQQSAVAKGYGKASYTSAGFGKFMKNWLVAGPVSVKTDTTEPAYELQEKAFKTDSIGEVKVAAGSTIAPVVIHGKELAWQMISGSDDIISLDTIYKASDYAYAYALAEITVTAATNVILAVGSDDAIKVWLNGKPVHENWAGRGVVKDNDLVPLKLQKGNNQVLLKVQNVQGGWGFVARVFDKAALTILLNEASGNGNIDKINLLIDGGADVTATNENGISPVISAKISGRDDIVQLLLKKGATDQPVPSPEILTDNFYKALKGKESPGIAVLVAKDGKILYRKGFGYADIKNKIPVTPDTKFRIGSVTKQFTAAAILKLQERNLLSVNDKLSKFIADFPRGDEVSIHQLLTHTSGIHSYTNNDDFLSVVTKTISPDSLVNLIKKAPYDFNPGEKMMYNNSGYFLLGYIIAKVSAKPYAQFLQENFFDPLRMKNTGIHYDGIKLQQEAKGYAKSNNKYDSALNWDMSWAGGAGAIYSTLDDLLKWNQALYGGKVLSEKSFVAATTPVVLKNGSPTPMQYGYGLALNKFRGKEIIGHSGGLHGFLTQLAYFTKEKLTVVMFTNTAEPEVNFDPNRIAEAFLWNSMDKQESNKEAAVKPTNLQAFTGRYDLAGVGVLTITTENDKLYAQISGQAKYEIFPKSADEFFWKVVEARLKFIADGKGEFNQAVLFQGGQELKAVKLKDEPIIELSQAILDKYTGKYKFKNNLVVTVFKENNKLFAQATGQPKLEMSAVSETGFVIKEINAKVLFVKDGNEKIYMLKLSMNGNDDELLRIE